MNSKFEINYSKYTWSFLHIFQFRKSCDLRYTKNWAIAGWKPLEFPRHKAVCATQYLHIHYAYFSCCSLINLHCCVSHLQSIYELSLIIVLFGDSLYSYFNFLFWQTWYFAWSQFYIIIPSNTVLSKKKKNKRKANPF